jgi:hypothetical protein
MLRKLLWAKSSDSRYKLTILYIEVAILGNELVILDIESVVRYEELYEDIVG